MHKNFATIGFLGKNIHSLPECHSTNEVLSKMIARGEGIEGTVVMTEFQTGGKGQRGNVWVSEKGKNLLFSVLLKPTFLMASDGYLLNIVVGLSVRKAITELLPGREVLLKWPNDVYLGGNKISGILIETDLANSTIENANVGIGLNVNQSHFSLSNATSLLMETSKYFDRQGVLNKLLTALEDYYTILKEGNKGKILHEYHQHMMWKGEHHTFRNEQGEFEGVLLGVDQSGNLVLDCNHARKTFRTKEITFVR